jgi:hypothetical protein
MDIVILNYWGYETTRTYYKHHANHSLKKLAYANILRLKKARTLGARRVSYRRYFSGYKRVAHYKSYPGLFDKVVQNHIWSYAHYLALKFGYDYEELENDWHIVMKGDRSW